MRLKLVISVLVLIQALLFAHMLLQIDRSAEGAATSAQALPGQVTQLTIFPQTIWGGVWGTLEPGGETDVSITAGSITQTNVLYDDPDNNCTKTELIAGMITVDPALVGPVDPVYADGLLGLDSRSPFSAQAMFDTQRTFSLGPNTVELWSTETQGKLGPYIQAIGLAGPNLVFVTQTKRNAQNYAGDAANYQMILPAGNWEITYDSSDSCSLLDEMMTTEENEPTPRLDMALPEKFCTNAENEFYSVEVNDRTFCRPAEVGVWYCLAWPEASVTVSRDGTELQTLTTDSTGKTSFAPAENADYMLRVTDGNRTQTRMVRSDACLPATLGEREGRTIQYPAAEVTAPEQTYPGQPGMGPQLLEGQLRAQFVLIAWITVLVFTLSSMAFWKQHKDDSVLLLRLRILWYRIRS